MGGSSGGGARTPYEAPNTLSSAQNLRIVDAIAEGVLAGFANGDDAPFKSVFFNDTAVQNPDGSYNFKGVTGYFLRGTPEQTYVPGFDSTERTVAVSASVKRATPIVRAVTDGLVNRLRVTVGVERNVEVKSNGDSVAANTTMLVELANADGVKASQTVTFSEKGSSAFYHDVLFDVLPAAPFNIRVIRGSVDSTTDKLSNNTFFASYVEIIDAKLSYPHTAIAALKIDSDQFGNQVPRRNYLLKGKIVAVPSNYDPATRVYASDFWDGSFKQAWTNNPAWVFYDLLTQPRYSTLARRLNVADVDKWALYGIAQYCDQLVPDGFGGQEPRFVCNAYITDQRQAGELLTDLASVFTGLPLWNGNQVSVMLDKDSDPVASYTNSNVEESGFVYASAALKAIHTAVHVRYLDKYDGYRAKTEYVADDEAVKRYGLNIKSVTAFGCDSRGQAARFGAWLLQTELRQQNAVTFTVGREGLKHLPYDIIQIADNDYVGVQMAGRVLAVSGSLITLDRDVADAVGGQLQFVAYETVDGVTRPRAKSVKVTAQPAANQLQLEHAPELAELDAWVLSAKVKPRLWRAIGIKENTDEGTYTINALLHDPAKYAAVDGAANFDRDITTLHNTQPVLVNGNVGADGGAVVITWDNLSADGTVLTYDIKIMRNGKLERHIPDADSPEIRLQGLPNGEYVAEIRGRNARGVLSDPLTKAWSINYTITGLRTTPKLFAISLAWTLPEPVVRTLHTEIWYGTENDINKAAKLAALPYPQNEYTLTGVKISDRYYFWTRIVDDSGSSGEYTASVAGVCDTDPAPIIAQITGAITESTLSRALIDQLDSKIAAGDAATAATAAAELQKEANARAAALQQEANARAAALQAEANARVADVNAARSKAASDLTAKAAELGSKITAVENVNSQQAQQINTVTAAQGATAAGLEAEKKARADGDAAEASARNTLAARVTDAEGSITRNDNLRVSGDKANADAIAAMGVRVGSAESGLTAEQRARAAADDALAEQTSGLRASVSGAARNTVILGADGADRWQAMGATVAETAVENGVLVVGNNAGNDYWPVAHQDLLPLAPGIAYKLTWRLAMPDNPQGAVMYLGYAGVAADGVALVNINGENSPSSQHYLISGRTPETAMTDYVGYAFHAADAARFARADGGRVAHADVRYIRPIMYLNYSNKSGRTQFERLIIEVLDAGKMAVQAELTEFKQVQATKDAAQTAEINAAKSQLAGNTADIGTIKTTKADKTEVAALARTTLQSEWRSDVDAAKAAAGTDAQNKADAAKAAADTAAQAKADAAKAQAIAAASNDAKTKADAAKAQAIADAAAKDATIKQQAADDAKTKADAAQAAAISEAQRLNNATNASVTALQQTVANDRQAAATAQQNLSAKIDQVQADLTEQVTTRVDLSAAKYNVDTYYPVRFALSATVKRYAFRVFAVLGRAQQDKDVAWSTHNTKTFSVNLAWQVNAYGWGTQYIDRVIDQFGFLHTAQSPVLGPDQMSNSSIEYVWLRGGASYDVTHHKTARPQIVDASYTTANQTINTTAYNATLVPKTDQARTDAAIAVVSADLSSYKSAQASTDAAQTAEINAAKSRLGNVEAGVTSLQTTVANNQSATATSINKLQSGMTAGGNLVAGGDFRDPAAWRSHYGGTDISSLFLSDIPSSPTPPYCFGRAIGNCYNYSNTDVTIAQNRTYRFSAWFNNSGNANGIFGFNCRRITGDKGYAGKVVSVPLGWHYREVIMTGSEFGASIINPGFFVNHTGTVGNGFIADYKFEDITDQQNLSASITETKSTVTALNGKVQGLYSLQVQAVGARKAVAGLALGADGATGDSQMLVMADKFALVRPGTQEIQTPFVVSTVNGATKLALAGDLYADGTILGKHIAANQTITAPVINGGSLNIGGGNFTVNGAGALVAQNASITGNVNATSGVFKGRIEANDGYFNGTIRAEKIEGDVLKMIQMDRKSEGVYELILPARTFPIIWVLMSAFVTTRSYESPFEPQTWTVSVKSNNKEIIRRVIKSTYADTIEYNGNIIKRYEQAQFSVGCSNQVEANTSVTIQIEVTHYDQNYGRYEQWGLDFVPVIYVSRA